MAEMKLYTATLTKKSIIAPRILELSFTKPAGFAFLPGQFVQFSIPDGSGAVLRSYSIASVPDQPELLFCVKIISGGKASAFFDALEVGSEVRFGDPKGVFTVRPGDKKQYFIATGTGLAPVIAMLESLVSVSAHLLFGVRYEEDLFWLDRIHALQTKNPFFECDLTLSQPSEDWRGERGRVTEHLVIDSAGEYYICGSVEMVKDVRGRLIERGVNTKSIHFEIF